MQKKKIFIEIEVPGSLKKHLMRRIGKWRELPVKWVREENLHLTVAFLGYVDESVIPEICARVSEAAAAVESFDVAFDRIVLAPSPDKPQMIWLEGQASEELKFLVESIEESLGISQGRRKALRPHVTLGRIRSIKWKELEQQPAIEESCNVSFTVEDVQVMESSQQQKGGPEYTALEVCPLI